MEILKVILLLGIINCQLPYDGTDRFDDFYPGEYAGQTIKYAGGTFFNQCGDGCLRCDYLLGVLIDNVTPDEHTLQCFACDQENGYGTVWGEHCIKNTDKNCLYAGRMRNKGKDVQIIPDYVPCQVCKEGYFADYQGVCQELEETQLIEGCKNYDYNASQELVCAICQDGYKLNQTTYLCDTLATASKITNCLIHQSNTDANNGLECKKCAEGYMLNTTLTACILVPEIKHCSAYTTEQCVQCNSTDGEISNFQSVPQNADIIYKGVPTSDNLQLNDRNAFFNFADAQCQANSNSLDLPDPFPTNGEGYDTIPIVRWCQKWDNSNNCLACYAGYILSEDKLTCNRHIDNCKSYDNQFQCNKCKSGYHLHTTNIGQVQINCVADVSVTNCKNYGTYTYTDYETGVTSYINGCIECKKGYYTTDGSTCDAQTTITKCSTYHKYKNACVECSGKFIPSIDGQCVAEIEKCLLANTSGVTCNLCEDLYFFDSLSGDCIKNTIDNCALQVTSTACQFCEENFDLVNGGTECVDQIGIPNCIRSVDNQCIECDEGYALLDDSAIAQCFQIPDDKCLTADASVYTYTTSGTTFTPYIQYNCTSCKSGYVVIANKCYKASSVCKNNSYWDETEMSCVAIYEGIENCAVYADPETCLFCKNEYYLDGNACAVRTAADISDCDYYEGVNGSDCASCTYESGFYYNGTACVANSGGTAITTPGLEPTRCLYYNMGFTECVQCINEGVDNVLIDGLCVDPSTVAQCNKWNSSNECVCCSGGYYLNPVNNTCQSFVGSVYSGVSNCLCQHLGQCAQCANGYINVNGECVAYRKTQNHCELVKELQQAQCVMCEYPYQLAADGTCVEQFTQVENCDYYNKNIRAWGTCAWCNADSYQDQYSNCRKQKDMVEFYEKLDQKFFLITRSGV